MCYKFYYLWQGWAVILWSCIMISSNMAWCSCRFHVKGKPSPHIPKQIKIKWMDFVPLQIPQLEGCPCSSGTNLSCTCSNWHGFGNQKVHGGGNVVQWAGNLFAERYARCQPQGTTSLPDNAKVDPTSLSKEHSFSEWGKIIVSPNVVFVCWSTST